MNTLTTLQRAIQGTIQRRLNGVCTCEWYPVIRKAIVAPAVLLELVELSPSDNAGTEEFSVHLRFEARVVMDYTTPDSVLATQQRALELACLIENHTWDCPLTPARVIQAMPDAFRPELDAYCVWRVEWQQQGRFGQSVWTSALTNDSPSRPHTVMVGIEPTDTFNTKNGNHAISVKEVKDVKNAKNMKNPTNIGGKSR